MKLSHDQRIPFMDEFPSKRKHIPTPNLYMNAHNNILHDTQKIGELKCPSVNEWIKKMSYSMKCHLATKKK
jgi:hypothetical protein